MAFDLAASLRRLKPQRIAPRLQRREGAGLKFVTGPAAPGASLMLDTCVYIDLLQSNAPLEIDALLRLRTVNHSTVVLSELTHLFGAFEPAHRRTRLALVELRSVIEDIPAHRLSRPSEQAFGEAGLLAGLAVRLAGRKPGVELLNDALLLLQALESGCVLLTRNLADFDLLQQLVPQARVAFYRTD